VVPAIGLSVASTQFSQNMRSWPGVKNAAYFRPSTTSGRADTFEPSESSAVR